MNLPKRGHSSINESPGPSKEASEEVKDVGRSRYKFQSGTGGAIWWGQGWNRVEGGGWHRQEPYVLD